jgi:hypothetical protein
MSDETTPNVPETDASATEAKPDQPPEAKAEAPETAEAPEAKQPDGEAEKPAASKAKAADEDGEKPARAPKAKAAADGDGEKPARPPKKEKAPALEDKPFADFINQDFLPALKQTLAKTGISDLDLKFEKRKLPIAALDGAELWQVIGQWQGGQRQFHIIFSKEDIQAPKFFTWADYGAQSTLLESFMIDERKINLDLLLLYTVQRLNGQKWLVMN